MNKERLEEHIKLCRSNLNNQRVECCALCPFEKEIVGEYPELEKLFFRKRIHYNIMIDGGL